jgi:hypothetical protein
MDYVSIYLDHPSVGCGFRRALVASKGPKWVRLFYPAGLASFDIVRGLYDNAKPVVIEEYNKTSLANLISRQITLAKKQQRFDGGNTAVNVIRFLTTA